VQKDEFLRLAINGIHNDLISRNEAFQSLALTFVANSELAACRKHTHITVLCSSTNRQQQAPVVAACAAGHARTAG
jgi:hypothetical protein